MARRTTTTGSAVTVRKHVPSEVRRQQILDSATELFARHGFEGTTTKQIADAVGTSETVLFRHFPSKAALYSAILERRVPEGQREDWLAHLREIADRRDDAALFKEVVAGILVHFRRDPIFIRLSLFASLEDHELARISRVRRSGPLASFLREYISRRQAEGAFRQVRPEIIVNQLIGSATHFALWDLLGSNPLGLSDDEVAAGAITVLIGIQAHD